MPKHAGGRPPRPLLDRFVDRIELSSDGCWIWKGSKNRHGYGVIVERFGVYQKRQSYTHRVAYELFIGELPDDHDAHHQCERKDCVNPNHLVAIKDGEHSRLHGFPAYNLAKTHCAKGHPFDEANTYPRLLPNGRIGRGCRTCMSIHSREYYLASVKKRDQGEDENLGPA